MLLVLAEVVKKDMDNFNRLIILYSLNRLEAF
jgi:hypothetical protein